MKELHKVLIADDDKMLVDMYRERLELAGYEVIACDNGELAIKEAHEHQPDLILLDIMMPHVDGYQVLTSLKSDPKTKDIPIVMLTALIRDLNRQKAIDLGAIDYIVKSETMPGKVIDKVHETLEKYQKSKKPLNGIFRKIQKPIHSSPFEEAPMVKIKTRTEVLFEKPKKSKQKLIKISAITLGIIVVLFFIIYVAFL